MVSIIPGMENLAPERTETRRLLAGSPKRFPVAPSTSLRASRTWSHIPAGNVCPLA